MSLATDSIFVTALQSNSDLLEKLTEYIDDDDNIQYVSMKPCYWQVLRYLCDTIND